MPHETRNPYTGEVLKSFSNATDAEVRQAIADAHRAFLSWRETSLAERAQGKISPMGDLGDVAQGRLIQTAMDGLALAVPQHFGLARVHDMGLALLIGQPARGDLL